MATEKGAVTQVIIQVVIEATKAAVQVSMAERGNETTGHRNEAAGVRHKIGRPSPT